MCNGKPTLHRGKLLGRPTSLLRLMAVHMADKICWNFNKTFLFVSISWVSRVFVIRNERINSLLWWTTRKKGVGWLKRGGTRWLTAMKSPSYPILQVREPLFIGGGDLSFTFLSVLRSFTVQDHLHRTSTKRGRGNWFQTWWILEGLTLFFIETKCRIGRESKIVNVFWTSYAADPCSIFGTSVTLALQQQATPLLASLAPISRHRRFTSHLCYWVS